MGPLNLKSIRLVVNADDFGESEEVNDAVIEAHRKGVLSSCSLMVTGKAFGSAVQLAIKNPQLAVGLHLVVVMGRSVLPKSVIPTLVNDERQFPSDPITVGLKYYFSRQAQQELEREMSAQFELFRSTGLPFSHIDGHLHMHAPCCFWEGVEVGRTIRVRRMRVPEEELRLALRFKRASMFSGTIYWFVFCWLARTMKKHLRAKVLVCRESLWNSSNGKMNRTPPSCCISSEQRNEIHCIGAPTKSVTLLSEQVTLQIRGPHRPRVIEFVIHHRFSYQLFRIRFVRLRTPLVLILEMLAQVTGNILLSKGMKQILPGSPSTTSHLLGLTSGSGSPDVWLGFFFDRLFLLFTAFSWADLSFVLPPRLLDMSSMALVHYLLLGQCLWPDGVDSIDISRCHYGLNNRFTFGEVGEKRGPGGSAQ